LIRRFSLFIDFVTSCSLPEAPTARHSENGTPNTLRDLFTLFLLLPPHAAEALALWTVHTYGFDLRDVTPYLGIQSIEPGCGKTTLLNVLAELTNNALSTSNISRSAFFRAIDEMKPTLLIDEADTFLPGNDGLRGILNAGYKKKGAYVLRAVPHSKKPCSPSVGQEWEAEPQPQAAVKAGRVTPCAPDSVHVAEASAGGGLLALLPAAFQNRNAKFKIVNGLRRFSLWCPKAIALIGSLPQSLTERCIIIRMEKKDTRHVCEPLNTLDTIAAGLRDQCAKFVATHADRIAKDRPAIPANLKHRAAEIWEPLLVLADLAGGDWPQRARDAALGLSAAAQEQTPISLLLMDLLLLFSQAPGQKKFFTRDLLDYLNGLGTRPWFALTKGKPVTDMWLSTQLRPYGIAPKTIWFNDRSAKGYALTNLSRSSGVTSPNPKSRPKEQRSAKPSAAARPPIRTARPHICGSSAPHFAGFASSRAILVRFRNTTKCCEILGIAPNYDRPPTPNWCEIFGTLLENSHQFAPSPSNSAINHIFPQSRLRTQSTNGRVPATVLGNRTYPQPEGLSLCLLRSLLFKFRICVYPVLSVVENQIGVHSRQLAV
jgi:hypothetical protein